MKERRPSNQLQPFRWVRAALRTLDLVLNCWQQLLSIYTGALGPCWDPSNPRQIEVSVSMSDTFLIDREGRGAARYAGVVDKPDVEKNIRNLLNQS